MLKKLTPFLLIITIGLSPVLNAFAGSLPQPDSAPPASTVQQNTQAKDNSADHSTPADCCASSSLDLCSNEAECCSHCYASLITLALKTVSEMQPLPLTAFLNTTAARKTQPLIRPPRG